MNCPEKDAAMAALDVTEQEYDELIGLFLEVAGNELLAISRCRDADRWPDIAPHVHSLKGMAGNLRLERCHRRAVELEQALRSGNRPGLFEASALLENAVEEIRTRSGDTVS